MIQCVKLPRDPPCDLTEFGKISEMKTQMTAPCENAKKAIKPIRYQITLLFATPLSRKAYAVKARKRIIPKEPMISNVFLPKRSIKDIASKVKPRFAAPI